MDSTSQVVVLVQPVRLVFQVCWYQSYTTVIFKYRLTFLIMPSTLECCICLYRVLRLDKQVVKPSLSSHLKYSRSVLWNSPFLSMARMWCINWIVVCCLITCICMYSHVVLAFDLILLSPTWVRSWCRPWSIYKHLCVYIFLHLYSALKTIRCVKCGGSIKVRLKVGWKWW